MAYHLRAVSGVASTMLCANTYTSLHVCKLSLCGRALTSDTHLFLGVRSYIKKFLKCACVVFYFSIKVQAFPFLKMYNTLKVAGMEFGSWTIQKIIQIQ